MCSVNYFFYCFLSCIILCYCCLFFAQTPVYQKNKIICFSFVTVWYRWKEPPVIHHCTDYISLSFKDRMPWYMYIGLLIRDLKWSNEDLKLSNKDQNIQKKFIPNTECGCPRAGNWKRSHTCILLGTRWRRSLKKKE